MAQPAVLGVSLPPQLVPQDPLELELELQTQQAQSLEETKIRKESLRFTFHGFAIWLELEQFPTTSTTTTTTTGDDLDQVIQMASEELMVHPIPVPHMTALYGINHLTEREARTRFLQMTHEMNQTTSTPTTKHNNNNNKWKKWPMMEPSGFVSGVEVEGKNGGEMSMAWIEASYESSTEHEELLDQIHQYFYQKDDADVDANADTNEHQEKQQEQQGRKGPWCPHVSFAYDNEDSPISNEYLAALVERHPTLALPRKVQSLSLWDLNGKIDEWSLLERVSLIDI